MIDAEHQHRRRGWRWIERLLLIAGIVCLGWYIAEVAMTRAYQADQAARLDQVLTTNRQTIPLTRGTGGRGTWSTGGDAGATSPGGDPGLIGRIEIDRVGVSSMVRSGDDTATLRRAVGHLTDTARPGDTGNVVLAGHRDTFFRGLRNIRRGDLVRLTTPAGEYRYRVSGTSIVPPTDVSVLNATATKSLTLVTCYPFAYVGSAPERFIVHADQIAEPASRLEAVAATAATAQTVVAAAEEQPAAPGRQTIVRLKPDATTVGRPQSADTVGLAAAAVRTSAVRHRAAHTKTRGIGSRKAATSVGSVGSKTVWSKILTPFRKLFGKGDRKAPAAKAPSKARRR